MFLGIRGGPIKTAYSLENFALYPSPTFSTCKYGSSIQQEPTLAKLWDLTGTDTHHTNTIRFDIWSPNLKFFITPLSNKGLRSSDLLGETGEGAGNLSSFKAGVPSNHLEGNVNFVLTVLTPLLHVLCAPSEPTTHPGHQTVQSVRQPRKAPQGCDWNHASRRCSTLCSAIPICFPFPDWWEERIWLRSRSCLNHELDPRRQGCNWGT